jgi:hypothetical protein
LRDKKEKKKERWKRGGRDEDEERECDQRPIERDASILSDLN